MTILHIPLEIAMSNPQLPAPILFRSADVPAQGLMDVRPDGYRGSADGRARRLP